MMASRTDLLCDLVLIGAMDTLRVGGSVFPLGSLGGIGTLGASVTGALVGTLRGVGVVYGRALKKCVLV